MNLIPAILIAGAVYLAFRHGPTVAALLRLEFSFYTFDVIKVEENVIKTSVTMKAENSTKTDLLLQNINAGITLNNKLIGLLTHNYNLLIRAGSTEYLTVLVDIKKSQVGAELWNMIVNLQTQFLFEISGKVTANNSSYPLTVSWSMDDIIQIINPKTTGKTIIPEPYIMPRKDRPILSEEIEL